ncbi:MAG TPA: hypothetical protein VFN55_05930 [Solirubrobacteraceae bacterium]|nr:hypothetical protein [Solirubrobacteraceae bacterium]
MEIDGDPAAGVYTNRPSRAAAAGVRGPVGAPPPGTTGQRALDRMFVALRAYEQRAQRRLALRAWLVDRRAETASAGG